MHVSWVVCSFQHSTSAILLCALWARLAATAAEYYGTLGHLHRRSSACTERASRITGATPPCAARRRLDKRLRQKPPPGQTRQTSAFGGNRWMRLGVTSHDQVRSGRRRASTVAVQPSWGTETSQAVAETN